MELWRRKREVGEVVGYFDGGEVSHSLPIASPVLTTDDYCRCSEGFGLR